MSTPRVAIIYDDTARPETTGAYCLRALRGLADVRHFLPSQAEHIPASGFDLYLRVDDGIEHPLPAGLRPRAWWAIDTHLDFGRCLSTALGSDLVFAAQRDGAGRLRREGAASATWLPLACDPGVHRRHDLPKATDLCFVGNVFPGEREGLLRLLRRHFPDMLVARLYFEEMARAYSASRLVFNRSIRDDLNMRVFEALACGSLLLTNALGDGRDGNGQDELFRDGTHLATYASADELLDKARFYLARDAARERIAAAGREEVLARHTYRHRMEAILAAAARLPRALPAGPPAAPAPPAPGVEAQPAQDGGYFEWDRPELLALVPLAARRVLDVGCGAGRLGAAVKARQQAFVAGIEYDPGAAAAARRRLDQVVAGDIEELDPGFAPGGFDAVICGDVLEHLREPALVLRRIRDWLAPGGVVVASIPNARHHGVIAGLLAGSWTYEAAGLLDHTHLRFFTRRGVEDLFHQAGLRVLRTGAVPGPGYEGWAAQGRPGAVRVGRLSIEGLAPEEAEEFYAYQLLAVAEPARPAQAHAHAQSSQGPAPQAAPRVLSSGGCGGGPMRFTQDFIRDFEQFDFSGPPFAFARFADGERAVCMGTPVAGGDGWAYAGGASALADAVNAALRYDGEGYHVGISDSCCDGPARDWYLKQVRVPPERLTFSNVFVNWNYRRFRLLDLSGAVTVASEGGDFAVPADLFATPFDIDALVDQLLRVDRPILVSAGPASGVIIHRYWERAGPARRQVIVDVGSAIDERTKGRRTRAYQQPGTRTAELVCRW